MTILELIRNIDKSKQNEDIVDVSIVAREFNLMIENVEQNRLKSYWVYKHFSDSVLTGVKIYFLNEEPIAITTRLGRKDKESFTWFSEELALKVKDYLKYFPEEEEELELTICDINENTDSIWRVLQ